MNVSHQLMIPFFRANLIKSVMFLKQSFSIKLYFSEKITYRLLAIIIQKSDSYTLSYSL